MIKGEWRSYKWIVLLITCTGSLMGPLDSTIVSVSLPTISASLKMDYALSIWVPTAYLVTVAVLLLTLGRLSDMRGRKPIFIAGFSIFVLGSFLCSIATSGAELVAFRVLQGAGAAFTMATSTAIVTDVFPSNERGKALGLNAMSVYLGLSLGPALGGVLTQTLGWQSVFWVNIPIGVLVIALATWKLQEKRPTRLTQRFDITGMLAFSVGLVTLLVALTLGEGLGWLSATIIGMFLVSLVSFVTFVTIERRKGKEAMFDISLVSKNRLFAAANIATLLNYAAYFGVAFVISFYMQRVLGLSLVQTGMILLVMPVTMSVLSPISGYLSDRSGSRVLSTSGMVIIAFGLVLLSTLGLNSSYVEVTIYLLIIGIGMGLFSSPNTSAIMGCVERGQLGVASGTVSTMRTVGQSLSLAVMGAIISTAASTAIVSSLFSGSKAVQIAVETESFVSGMSLAFLVSAGIALVGAAFSLARGPVVKVCPLPSEGPDTKAQ